ncbi:MAG: SRPBCC family protein [Candidatus Dormibacteraeota bacterium]|nr:SRPBCC family protein [Candidatus Dormibacteraeota bacterium]
MNKAVVTVEPVRHDIVLTRVFDAPRELVFKTYTDPELIPRWWGPRNLTTKVERMDVRPGGGWRFVQRDSEGHEFAFHGVYHEVSPPDRIVDTFEFEGMPGHVALETTTLEDLGGKTRLTTITVFQTIEDRNGMVASGMEQGASESMDRLEELLGR